MSGGSFNYLYSKESMWQILDEGSLKDLVEMIEFLKHYKESFLKDISKLLNDYYNDVINAKNMILLNNISIDNIYDLGDEFQDVISFIFRVENKQESLYDIMYEVEWWVSCDHSIDDVKRAFEEYKNKT